MGEAEYYIEIDTKKDYDHQRLNCKDSIIEAINAILKIPNRLKAAEILSGLSRKKRVNVGQYTLSDEQGKVLEYKTTRKARLAATFALDNGRMPTDRELRIMMRIARANFFGGLVGLPERRMPRLQPLKSR